MVHPQSQQFGKSTLVWLIYNRAAEPIAKNAIEDPNNAKKSANEETNKTVDPASDEAVYSQPESGTP